MEIRFLSEGRAHAWEPIEKPIAPTCSWSFLQKRGCTGFASDQPPRESKPMIVKHVIGCGTAVLQKLLIRLARDTPWHLVRRFIHSSQPLSTGAPREGAWQSACVARMVERELLPIKAIELAVVPTVKHACFDSEWAVEACRLYPYVAERRPKLCGVNTRARL